MTVNDENTDDGDFYLVLLRMLLLIAVASGAVAVASGCLW